MDSLQPVVEIIASNNSKLGLEVYYDVLTQLDENRKGESNSGSKIIEYIEANKEYIVGCNNYSGPSRTMFTCHEKYIIYHLRCLGSVYRGKMKLIAAFGSYLFHFLNFSGYVYDGQITNHLYNKLCKMKVQLIAVANENTNMNKEASNELQDSTASTNMDI